MKFSVRMAVLFYVTTVMFLGAFLAVYTMHWIGFQDIVDIFYVIYHDDKMRQVFGILSVIILVKNYLFARAITNTHQRERTIAFDNPTGRVSVSLAALEDVVRKVTTRVSGVKEVRSEITARSKGLDVVCRLVLNTDLNIPELTSRLQDTIKRKIQDMIGIEGNIDVRMHVTRIIPEERKARGKEIDEYNPPPRPPLQGFGS